MLMIAGAHGWEHKQWEGNYYPDEIALDWHLSFYARDYQTALCPIRHWSNCNISEIKEFCEDVDKDYPIFFEKKESDTNTDILALQQAMLEFVPNWISFENDGWNKQTDKYHIRQAEILHSTNLKNNPAVFSVHSESIQRDTVLKEIMLLIKTEFKTYETVYLFCDGALAEIDVLNTIKTLRKMLVLDF